jgi:hypothetical protein
VDPIPQIPNIDNGNKEIPDINIGIRSLRFIQNIGPPRRSTISNINVDRIWVIEPSQAIPYQTPITTGMGTPIVDMPGCVMVNKENAKRPPNKNKQLVNDDPKQNVVLCDGGMPYFTAPNYDARELSWQTVYGEPEEQESGIDTGDTPDLAAPETPERPNTEEPEGDPDCPGPLEPRLGSVGPNEKEKVSGYELQPDPNNANKKICVVLYEDIGIVEQYLPSPQIATTTAVIASVAASSALLAKPLADLLLRVVKPAVKQVMTKVNAILGKTPYRPTQAELRTNEYRKKKGLLGINFAKEHSKKMKKQKEEEKKKSQKKN